MSTREMVYNIIDGFSDIQLIQVLSMLQNVKNLIDDAEDDEICEAMMREYLEDDSPDKHDTVSLEDFAAEMGININERMIEYV